MSIFEENNRINKNIELSKWDYIFTDDATYRNILLIDNPTIKNQILAYRLYLRTLSTTNPEFFTHALSIPDLKSWDLDNGNLLAE